MNSIHDFYLKKTLKNKITMLTCYDYPTALMLEKAEVDCVLVGDSVSMVVHGFSNTIGATVEMMAMHTSAVSRGLKKTFVVSDLPFLSYRKSLAQTMDAVDALIRAGAHAIKLEGADGNLETIEHIVKSGVPVMGHIGLTPQHVHQLGGFKVQGKSKDAGQLIIDQAIACEKAGCFALVLECVPKDLAKKITETLNIATIGIGAGADTDGQVLVTHDMLGVFSRDNFKFVKKYCDFNKLAIEAFEAYITDVKSGHFPDKVHSFESY